MNPVVRTVVGAVVGAAIGYAIYRFVGCRTGACPLSANPWVAMFIWGSVGALMATSK